MLNLWLVYFDEKTNLDVEVTISHQLGGWVSLNSSYNTVVGRMDSFGQNCISFATWILKSFARKVPVNHYVTWLKY